MTLPKKSNAISRFSRNAAQACIFFMYEHFLYFLSLFLNTSFKEQCNQTELSKLQSHVNTPMLITAI